MLQRPFKVTRIGPVKLFVSDIDASERFYTELLGLTKTEEVRLSAATAASFCAAAPSITPSACSRWRCARSSASMPQPR